MASAWQVCDLDLRRSRLRSCCQGFESCNAPICRQKGQSNSMHQGNAQRATASRESELPSNTSNIGATAPGQPVGRLCRRLNGPRSWLAADFAIAVANHPIRCNRLPAPMSTNGDRGGEHVRVAIIGTGFSGLGMAIRLKQEGIDDFVVLERALVRAQPALDARLRTRAGDPRLPARYRGEERRPPARPLRQRGDAGRLGRWGGALGYRDRGRPLDRRRARVGGRAAE